jgi:hypothetical protein
MKKILLVTALFTTNVIFVKAQSTNDFVITVKTDNIGTSTDLQFTIPTTGTDF